MWYLKEYDPVKAGSIDGTDTEPHDAAIDRATQSQLESALKAHFEKYGEIASVSLIRNQVTGLSQGYGFVSFKQESDAKSAYKEANKSVLDGHVVLVDFERSRVMKDWVPRRLGGGFGGKKDSGQLRFGARDRPFKQPASGHVRIPYEQKFSDTWKEHQNEKKSRRSKSPSRSRLHSESSQRRTSSRSPSDRRSRYSNRRSPSNDRHDRYSRKSGSSSHRHSSYDRHKRHRHDEHRRERSTGYK
ncbi:hypothetical protein MBANPS3_009625 [Mucor bainieri]